MSHKIQVWSHEIHYLHFFRVHSCSFVVQKKHTVYIFFVFIRGSYSPPAIFFVCFVFFVVKSFFSHSCPFVSIRGSYSPPAISFVCFVFFVVPLLYFVVHSCPFVVLTLLLLSLSCVSCFSWFKTHTIYIFSWFVPSFSILQSVMPSLKIAISWQWLTSLRARVSPDAIVRTVSRNSSTFGFAMASQSIQCGFFCARE